MHVHPDNERAWEEARVLVDSFADKLGKGVDMGIKETIVALTVHGFGTSGSCEGHHNWGTRGPYVDIVSKETEELTQRMRDARSEEEAKAILEELKRKNLELRRLLLMLLEEFYQERKVPVRIMLVAQDRAWNRIRLQSHGVELQMIEAEEVVVMRLSEYKEEMHAFTRFLKQKYFAPHR